MNKKSRKIHVKTDMENNKNTDPVENTATEQETSTTSSTPEDATAQVANEIEAAPTTESHIEVLQEELKAEKDRRTRLYADFENYRRQTNKEKLELRKTATESLMTELVGVLDDFERAFQHNEGEENKDLQVMYDRFKGVLQAAGLSEFNALDETFDPEQHEALANLPTADADKKGKVIEQIRKGYKLSDKIIRYPQVIVGQ